MLTDDQEDRVQNLIAQLDLISTETDVEGNEQILAVVYELAMKIYERHPELDEDD